MQEKTAGEFTSDSQSDEEPVSVGKDEVRGDTQRCHEERVSCLVGSFVAICLLLESILSRDSQGQSCPAGVENRGCDAFDHGLGGQYPERVRKDDDARAQSRDEGRRCQQGPFECGFVDEITCSKCVCR